MTRKLFIKTYGCQMNVYDSARMADLLAPLGYAPACRLYRRAGFREVGRRQGYYEDGATALVLRRDLG